VSDSTRKTVLVDRCPDCGEVLGWWDGESYCPSCTRWTLTEPGRPIDDGDVDALLLALAIYLSEGEG
jgi:uncharacterized Zn finger protein (UPF0148 family)